MVFVFLALSGTTAHIFGMSLTSANHGAFLLQMTTLIVPVVQGLRGAEKIPMQIRVSIGLALAGIVAFTQDPATEADVKDPMQQRIGDGLVLTAAFLYSLYDIQTYYWGRVVPRTELVTIKIGFQAIFSCVLCLALSWKESLEYMARATDWDLVIPTILWSGLIVNALATFLQVGGMLAVGPTRAQTIFASQPLWAAVLNFFFLGEIMGAQGFLGGGAFLLALFLAATAEAPVPHITNQPHPDGYQVRSACSCLTCDDEEDEDDCYHQYQQDRDAKQWIEYNRKTRDEIVIGYAHARVEKSLPAIC